MTPIELERTRAHQRARTQVQAHIADAGRLSDVASVLIKYIYHLSPECYFERMGGAASEWVLRPQNWIALYLSKGRAGLSGKVIVSVNLSPKDLRAVSKLDIEPGRFPQWSKFTIKHVSEVKGALEAIEYVHQES